jgi:hypothetical protein
LLCAKYLSGEVFQVDKDGAQMVIPDDELRFITPGEISAWGHVWIAKRLGRLLDVFEDAFYGMKGINDLGSVEWVRVNDEVVWIPAYLSSIWQNLLQALAATRSAGSPVSPLYMIGLQTVSRIILQIFAKDPSSYLPVCLIGADNRSTLPVDLVRVRTTQHLYDIAKEVLGTEAIGSIRIQLDKIPVNPNTTLVSPGAFGSDSHGNATMAGTLLGQLLRTRVLSLPLSGVAQSAFSRLISSVLDAGCVPGCSGKLLGDLTNTMPWIFEEDEYMQLEVWRILGNLSSSVRGTNANLTLAVKWTEVIDLQPPASQTSGTNHTGTLLVNLLSGPFRDRGVLSVWHQQATADDLQIWQGLLEAAVERSRVKMVGSNIGVLEALAGHLGDFLEANEKTASSTITLACLASAASYISFVPTEHHHGSHYNINQNFTPLDFLTLVNASLVEAYPQRETQGVPVVDQSISPAVGDLLDSLMQVFEDMPEEFVWPVLEPLREGLALWMEDGSRILDVIMGQRVSCSA